MACIAVLQVDEMMCILFYTDILRGMCHDMHRSAIGEYSTDVTIAELFLHSGNQKPEFILQWLQCRQFLAVAVFQCSKLHFPPTEDIFATQDIPSAVYMDDRQSCLYFVLDLKLAIFSKLFNTAESPQITAAETVQPAPSFAHCHLKVLTQCNLACQIL